MADNSREIKSLIKLRQQRPSYSRMISWELSQVEEQTTTKKRRSKKKQLTKASENNDEESDENNDIADNDSANSSEYETANEDTDGDYNINTLSISDKFDLGELSLTSQDITSMDVFDDSINSDGNDDDDDDGDDDELMISCRSSNSVTDSTTATTQSVRHRRPSKKQKRKRRKYFKVTYLDELFNLGSLFDADDNIDDVFNEVSEEGINVNIQYRVPTLVELCLNVNRRKRRANSTTSKPPMQENLKDKRQNEPDNQEPVPRSYGEGQVLPFGLKKLMSSRHGGKNDLQNLISHFLNKVLPVYEDLLIDSNSKSIQSYYAYTVSDIRPPVRSVWNVLPYPLAGDCNGNVTYGSDMSTAFLFTPTMHRCKEACNYGYRYEDKYNGINCLWVSALSGLANTIDLMLSTPVCTTAIIRVKRALNLRYKRLVQNHFEDVLPYVMWSRGLVSMATDMFKTLIDKSKDNTIKCMYLSEIGRMHNMFGDSSTAIQFFKLASERAADKIPHQENRENTLKEINGQEHILIASVHDTGVLDKDKAALSNSIWSYVISTDETREYSIFAGVNTYLCYHLDSWNESRRYDEAIMKIEKIAKTHEYFNYYLSMLYAFQGNEDMCTKVYRRMRYGPYGDVADLMISLLGPKVKNPWQPLIEQVKKQKSPVQPLKVIWRTLLQQPRISNHGSTEGQFCSEDIDLHINEMGHLSGNIHMLLPPLRTLSLDPHTGSVVIDKLHYTGMWTRACFDDESYHCEKLMVPTPVLIYQGSNHIKVELVNPTVKMCIDRTNLQWMRNGPPCPFMLYWKDSTGKVAKLNVFKEVKNTVKQDLKNTIKVGENTYKAGTFGFTNSEIELMYKLIDKAAEKNYVLDKRNFENAVMEVSKARKRKEKSQLKGAKAEKQDKKDKKKEYRLTEKFLLDVHTHKKYCSLNLLDEPFVFGSTIVLYLEFKPAKYLMFVNTRTKDEFLRYCLVKQVGGVIMDCVRNNCSDEEFIITYSCPLLKIYNYSGVAVAELDRTDLFGRDTSRCDILVIGQCIYCVTQQRTGIWKCMIGILDDDFNEKYYVVWSVESINETWQEMVQDSNTPPNLEKMEYIGKNFGEGIGKLLMLNFGVGLGFLNPETMEFVPVQVPAAYSDHYEFTSDGNLMKGKFEHLKIMVERSGEQDGCLKTWTIFGLQNKVFILETSHKSGDNKVGLSITFSLILPGVVKEVGIIGKWSGLLISLTQQHDGDVDYTYTEHVLQYNFDGRLCGVLPCLKAGPKSFFTTYFHGNQETDDNQSNGTKSLTGFHAYMKDGNDGIMCVQLNS
ncbi:hypothetical protein ACF0H5_010478 [Mactra antiquata]